MYPLNFSSTLDEIIATWTANLVVIDISIGGWLDRTTMSSNITIKPDPTTQSNYLDVTTEHVEFAWEIDFVYRVIEGSALHTMIVKVDEVHEVMSVPSYDN